MRYLMAFLFAASIVFAAEQDSQNQKTELAKLQLDLIKQSHSGLVTAQEEQKQETKEN